MYELTRQLHLITTKHQFRCVRSGGRRTLPSYLGRLLGERARAEAGPPLWRTSSPSRNPRVLFHFSGHFSSLQATRKTHTTPRCTVGGNEDPPLLLLLHHHGVCRLDEQPRTDGERGYNLWSRRPSPTQGAQVGLTGERRWE